MNDSTAENKICEACGEKFPCAVESGICWCFAVESTGAKLENLRDNFQDCVCSACLKSEDKLSAKAN